MSLGVFYVGERPVDPLLVSITNPDGSPRSLAEYDSVSLVGYGLPGGTTEVLDATAGSVKYTFTTSFTLPGKYEFFAHMTKGDRVDKYGPQSFSVERRASAADSWLSPSDAYEFTGTAVGLKDILQAMRDVGAVVNADLTAAIARARYGAADTYRLRQAVAAQAAAAVRAADAGTDAFSLAIPAGYTSVSMDGISVSRGAGAGGAAGTSGLDPVAARFLMGLTTRVRTFESGGLTGGFNCAEAHEARVWKPLR